MEQWQIDIEAKIDAKFVQQDNYLGARLSAQDKVLASIDKKLDRISVVASVVRWFIATGIAVYALFGGHQK